MFDMRRREFIALLGGAAVAWPIATRAQQPTMPVIGYPNINKAETPGPLPAFLEGLRSTGHVERQNVVLEYRWAEGQPERLPALARDLVGRNVAVIVTAGNQGIFAARTATATIPIVFYNTTDPMIMRYVASMNRPGGNLTGVSLFNVSLGAKRLELLHQFVGPNVAIAALVNPENASTLLHLKDINEAASNLGREILVARANTLNEVGAAFGGFAQQRIGALLIDDDAFFNFNRAALVAFAIEHHIATSFPQREAAIIGGLLSYGGSTADGFRQLGVYTGRILNGEKAGDLPIVQPTKYELVINAQTARMLGIEVPGKLLALADEVIE